MGCAEKFRDDSDYLNEGRMRKNSQELSAAV